MSKETKDEQGYNGWSNYETWVTKLWLDNDEGSYNYMRDLVIVAKGEAKACSQVREKIWTVKEAEKYLLGEMVKDEVVEMTNIERTTAGLCDDLLNSAIENINFNEIAENLLED